MLKLLLQWYLLRQNQVIDMHKTEQVKERPKREKKEKKPTLHSNEWEL